MILCMFYGPIICYSNNVTVSDGVSNYPRPRHSLMGMSCVYGFPVVYSWSVILLLCTFIDIPDTYLTAVDNLACFNLYYNVYQLGNILF